MNIFGVEKNSRILISFFNSVIKGSNPIKSVEIKNIDIDIPKLDNKSKVTK